MSTRLDLVVLGGGPAAFAAARGYRDAGGSGEVAIVADERRLPYNRPSLSKELLRGEMDERELPLADDEWLGSEDVRLLGGAAVAIDAGERTSRSRVARWSATTTACWRRAASRPGCRSRAPMTARSTCSAASTTCTT